MNPALYAKAIVAALSAGLLALQTAVTMSDRAHSWVTVGVAVLAAIAVYAVPNAPAPAPAPPTPAAPASGTGPPPNLQPPSTGGDGDAR